MLDFRFLDLLVRAPSQSTLPPMSRLLIHHSGLDQDDDTLATMLKIVLNYSIEDDLAEMQTVSAQDIKKWTAAHENLANLENFPHLEGVKAVLELLKQIRSSMEILGDIPRETTEQRSQPAEENLHQVELSQFRNENTQGEGTIYPFSPYVIALKKSNWEEDLLNLINLLHCKVDYPLPDESIYRLGAPARLDIEIEQSFCMLFSYDSEYVHQGPFELERLLSAQEKLRDREDFTEGKALATLIKLLQLSANSNMDARRANLRREYNSSWIINNSRLLYVFTQREWIETRLEGEEEVDLEDLPSADAYLELADRIATAGRFDVEAMDVRSLPARLRTIEQVVVPGPQADSLGMLDHLIRAMQTTLASTGASTSSSWGYGKHGWTRDISFLLGTVKEREKAWFNFDHCVRTIEGSNQLADIQLLEDDISRIIGILCLYQVEEMEFQSLACSSEMLGPAIKSILDRGGHANDAPWIADLRDFSDLLDRAVRLKKLEGNSATGHERSGWILDLFKLLILLGHRNRIWRDKALYRLTNMVEFNKTLDDQIAIVRNYKPEDMDRGSILSYGLRDMEESVMMLDGVLMWYQIGGVRYIVDTMFEAKEN